MALSVVNADRPSLRANRSGLEDEARLVTRELAALHMIGVVGELNLDPVVDATWHSRGALFLEAGKERRRVSRGRGLRCLAIQSLGLFGITMDRGVEREAGANG